LFFLFLIPKSNSTLFHFFFPFTKQRNIVIIVTTNTNTMQLQALQSPTLRPSPLTSLRNKHSLSHSHFHFQTSRRRASVIVNVATAPKRENDPKKRVVITGMGLVSVFGNEVDEYYNRLLSGESGIGPIDRFDASKFPTRFAGQIHGFSSEGYIDGKNDRRLDDCLRYCIVAGKKALVDADLGGDKLSKVLLLLPSLFLFDL
jgi:3-oxoacyl-[acyl-carrier-protein] synthase II